MKYGFQQQRNTYDMPCSQQKEEETKTHNNGLPRPLQTSIVTKLVKILLMNAIV